MAYLLDDEEQQKGLEDSESPSLGGGGSVEGSQMPASTANPQSPAPAASVSTPAPTSSGHFTDIRKYLDANQNQAEGMGQKVGDSVQSQLSGLENTAQTGAQDFQSQIDAQKPILSSEDVTSVAKDPNAYVQGDGNVDKFKSFLNQNYAGPNDVQDTTDQQNKVQELSDQTKTSGGRQNLVKGIYQAPEKATNGELSLDNALIEGTPNAINSITGKQTEAQRIQDELAANRTSQQGAITSAKDAITTNQGNANAALWENPDSTYQTLQNTVNANTTADQQAATKAEQEAMDAFNLDKLAKEGVYTPTTGNGVLQTTPVDASKINISNDALAQLGMSKDDYVSMLNKINQTNRMINNVKTVNAARNTTDARQQPALDAKIPQLIDTSTLQSYIKNLGPTGISAANVATPDQYAELSALSKLLGDSNPQLDFGYLGDGSKAGTANTDITNVDQNGLNSFINDMYKQISTGTPTTQGPVRTSSR